MEQPTTSLVILFADISGSTRLYEVLGDMAARQRVADCLALLADVVRRHSGAVLKTIGDEVMSTFLTADNAMQAARAMQEAVATATPPGQIPLTIRVGLHFGAALVETGDVFGDTVNVAARIVALAKGGQILTTPQLVTTLSPALRANTRHIDRAPVKGKQEEIDIYEFIWKEDDLTRMEGQRISSIARPARLYLRMGDQESELSQGRPNATLGRGPQNEFVVADEYASRLHARIEYRRGKFVLFDQSTNGTFVRTQDGKEVQLRREEFPLQGAGEISLGRAFDAASSHVIHFVCEP
jgi:adenylate cyclase